MNGTTYTAITGEIEAGRPAVLATLVKTVGSTPQKIGAQILVKQDGSCVGTVGGGCVEGDIWFAASQMLKKGPPCSLFEYTLNEDLAADNGLVCGGQMKFVLEVVEPTDESRGFYRDIMEALERGETTSVITVVEPPSGSGIEPFSKLNLGKATDTELTEVDEALLASARERAAEGVSCWVQEDTPRCAYYLAVYAPPTTLLVVGGGHIGQSVATVATLVGFKVVVIDDREDFANRERFPDVAATYHGDYTSVIADLNVNSNWQIVIVTRGHKYDYEALSAALRTDANYIGVMGSRRKGVLLIKELIKQGYSEEDVERVRTPVGVDIGAVTPPEIALSIVTELLSIKSKRQLELLSIKPSTLRKAIVSV